MDTLSLREWLINFCVMSCLFWEVDRLMNPALSSRSYALESSKKWPGPALEEDSCQVISKHAFKNEQCSRWPRAWRLIDENRAIHEIRKRAKEIFSEKAPQLTIKHSPSSASLWEIALTFKESVGWQKRDGTMLGPIELRVFSEIEC